MKNKEKLKYCLKLHSRQRLDEIDADRRNGLLPGKISAVRIIEDCNEHFASPAQLSGLFKKSMRFFKKGNPFVFQYEIPPLFNGDFPLFLRTLDFLAGFCGRLNCNLAVAANDYGVLNVCLERKIPVIIGRGFNKSHLRLPGIRRFSSGRWLTLDVVTRYLPSGPSPLPYLNEDSLAYLFDSGVAGIDIDGEPDLLKESLKAIKGRFRLYIHCDEIFMAAGRHCFIKKIYGKCGQNECHRPEFYFRFQKDMEKDCSFSYYDVDFYFRGKTVYRKAEVLSKRLLSAVTGYKNYIMLSYI